MECMIKSNDLHEVVALKEDRARLVNLLRKTRNYPLFDLHSVSFQSDDEEFNKIDGLCGVMHNCKSGILELVRRNIIDQIKECDDRIVDFISDHVLFNEEEFFNSKS